MHQCLNCGNDGAHRVADSEATQPSMAERSARLGARWRFFSAILVDGSLRWLASQRMMASRSYVTLRAPCQHFTWLQWLAGSRMMASRSCVTWRASD